MFKLVRAMLKLPRINRRYSRCPGEEFDDPNTKVTFLSNGLRMATEEKSSPMACVSLFVEVGPRYETAANNGMSHFIEHMAFKGFKTMGKDQFEHCLLVMGAKIYVETWRDMQVFTARCAAERAPYLLEVYSKMMCELELDMASIEEEKEVVRREMEDEDNNPKAVTFDYLHQTAFQGTPLAQRVIGPSNNLLCFNKEIVRSFMCDHYQPYKLCLATCGGVSHESLVSEANRHFNKMVPNPDFKSHLGASRFTGSMVVYRDDSMPFTHTAIALEAPGYAHADYLPLLVLSCMTGAWCKSQSGAAYHGPPLAIAAAHDNCHRYNSFYITYKDVGLWGIYYVADKMQVEDMMYNIQKQWLHMCMTSTVGDLERAVNAAKLKLSRRVVGAVRSSRDIGLQVLYTCGRRSLQSQLHALADIEISTLRATAYKYLYDKCPAVAAVGPTESVPDYTRIRAGQYSLRL